MTRACVSHRSESSIPHARSARRMRSDVSYPSLPRSLVPLLLEDQCVPSTLRCPDTCLGVRRTGLDRFFVAWASEALALGSCLARYWYDGLAFDDDRVAWA